MIRKSLLNNPGLKISSFVIAVLLWLVVANIENPVTTRQFKDVPVTIENENVINSINQVYEVKQGDTATFSVKGRRSVLENLTKDDFLVTANLAELSKVYAVPINVALKNETLDVEITKNNNTLIVALESVEEKNFPVEIITNGDVVEGYAIGKKTVEPNIITVKGPKSLIEKIEKVAVEVDVDNRRSTVSTTADLMYFDHNEEMLEPTSTKRIKSSDTTVKVKVDILHTKKIPVTVKTVGTVASGYSVENMNYEPQEIEVAGTTDVLERISGLTIDDVDISGLTEDQEYSFKVSDYVPSDVVLIDSDQEIMVTVKIGKIITKKLTLNSNQIDVSGADTKYQYIIDSDTAYKVTLTGFQDQINLISPSTLKPMIDVSGLTVGTYARQVSLKEIDGVQCYASGKVSVEVKKAN